MMLRRMFRSTLRAGADTSARFSLGDRCRYGGWLVGVRLMGSFRFEGRGRYLCTVLTRTSVNVGR